MIALLNREWDQRIRHPGEPESRVRVYSLEWASHTPEKYSCVVHESAFSYQVWYLKSVVGITPDISSQLNVSTLKPDWQNTYRYDSTYGSMGRSKDDGIFCEWIRKKHLHILC